MALLGVIDISDRKLDEDRGGEHVSALLEDHRIPPKMARIILLVIDDDATDRMAVGRALTELGPHYDLREASNGRDGLKLVADGDFDCILVDYQLPDTNGLDLLVELRARLRRPTAIVMLTGTGNEAVAVEAMKLGAHDYLPKSALASAALHRVITNAVEKCKLQKSLAEAQEKLENLALFDTLTGLGNRNLFHIELARALAISRRKRTTFVLLMMDLDMFKEANDTFGHEAGDAILAAVGLRLRASARSADSYFRLGGDEFTAILDAGSDGEAAALRIMTAVAEPVKFGGHDLNVAVSIGVAWYPKDAKSAEALIRTADAAMYSAKNSRPGRMSASSVVSTGRAYG